MCYVSIAQTFHLVDKRKNIYIYSIAQMLLPERRFTYCTLCYWIFRQCQVLIENLQNSKYTSFCTFWHCPRLQDTCVIVNRCRIKVNAKPRQQHELSRPCDLKIHQSSNTNYRDFVISKYGNTHLSFFEITREHL